MATEPASAATSQLVDYLATLRRRKWTIMIVTILALGAAIAFTKSKTPTYQANASVLLSGSGSSISSALGNASTPVNMADEIARLHSPAVAALVEKQLGSAPAISASNPTGTDVMKLTATSTVPSDAAGIANAYANAFIQQRQTDVINSYLSAAKVIQGQISNLNSRVAALPATINGTANPQVTALETQLGLLQQEANTLQTDASLGASGAQVVQPAAVPTSPSSPQPIRDGLIGFFGGLVLGIALAFLRESLDDTIASREDLDRAQPGLPVLGLIPVVSGRDSTKDLTAAARPHSLAAEAYRSLRTSVQFLGLDQPVKLLQVTSPRTAEGKTTTAANLAVTLAAAGQRVIIVDCDLRRSRLHSVFGLSNQEGFTSVLRGHTPISAALQKVEGQNLQVLTSGDRPPNPAELLSGSRSGEIFAALERMADIVIVDTPPVLPVTDAVLISPRMDATLLVVSAGSSTRKDLAGALEILGQVDAPLVGMVLNNVAVDAGYRYRYSYEPSHAAKANRS